MATKAFEFGNFRVDADERTLLEGGHPVALTPKAFDTLLLLVENAGRLMEKEAMMERLWPGTFVEEANLANNISQLRKVLGDEANRIQTVPRRGYRFTGEVNAIGDAVVVEPKREWSWRPIAIVAVAVIVAIAIGVLIGRALWRREPASFRQITFRRGVIWCARFEGDGATIVYSGSHEGKPSELFVTRADQRESRPLGIPGDLLALSKHGDLAILTKSSLFGFFPRGTLARVPITGGAPRELTDNVQEADWSPDGGSLAVLRWNGVVEQLEYPLGHVLFKASPPVWINALRVSPSGDELAFLLHESQRFDDRGRAVVVDRNGRIVRSSRVFTSASGLAWNRDELFVSASPSDLNNAIYAIDRNGHDRVLTRSAGRLMLFDVAPSGSILGGNEDVRTGILAASPGDARERDLSWLDGSWLRDLSADGRTLLFDEEGTGGGATAHVYVRTIDGSPATDLGEGHAVALSPDGKRVLARQRFTNPPRLILFSAGAGEPKPIRTGAIVPSERASWLGDGRIVFVGAEPHHAPRAYVYDPATERVASATPEGIVGTVVNASGEIAAHGRDGKWALYPIAGGSPRPLPGVTADDSAVRFTADGAALLVSTEHEIARIDLATGARDVLHHIATDLPPGTLYSSPASVSADGRTYAYTYSSSSMELFVIDDAK